MHDCHFVDFKGVGFVLAPSLEVNILVFGCLFPVEILVNDCLLVGDEMKAGTYCL